MSYSIVLGDHLPRTQIFANQHCGGPCELLTKKNHHELLQQPSPDALWYYTGLGDWDSHPEELLEVLKLAKTIVIAPFVVNNEFDPHNPTTSDSGTLQALDFYASRLSYQTPKLRYPLLDLTQQANQRYTKTNASRTLWAVGCSITAGVGVCQEESWPMRLAEKTQLSCEILAQSGSSIDWQADRILRSDIDHDDIVVWALTSPERFTWYDNDQTHHVTPSQIKKNIAVPNLSRECVHTLLVSDHFLHAAMFYINQVENFCNKIGARLLLYGALTSHALNLQLSTKSIFFPHETFHYNWLDLGTDNAHPGPRQHQKYCQTLFTHLRYLRYI